MTQDHRQANSLSYTSLFQFASTICQRYLFTIPVYPSSLEEIHSLVGRTLSLTRNQT